MKGLGVKTQCSRRPPPSPALHGEIVKAVQVAEVRELPAKQGTTGPMLNHRRNSPLHPCVERERSHGSGDRSHDRRLE